MEERHGCDCGQGDTGVRLEPASRKRLLIVAERNRLMVRRRRTQGTGAISNQRLTACTGPYHYAWSTCWVNVLAGLIRGTGKR